MDRYWLRFPERRLDPDEESFEVDNWEEQFSLDREDKP